MTSLRDNSQFLTVCCCSLLPHKISETYVPNTYTTNVLLWLQLVSKIHVAFTVLRSWCIFLLLLNETFCNCVRILQDPRSSCQNTTDLGLQCIGCGCNYIARRTLGKLYFVCSISRGIYMWWLLTPCWNAYFACGHFYLRTKRRNIFRLETSGDLNPFWIIYTCKLNYCVSETRKSE